MTIQSYQNGSISPVPSTEPGELNTIVAEIGKISFTGNLVPHAWYHHLKLSSGHTDLIGATLLADIVYQYRPGVVCDEATGQPLHMFKRFARDQFCAPVAYFVRKFDLTQDQVRQALKRLEEGGYIRREYRDIMVAGRWVRGMTFVEPVPEQIRAITPQTRPDLPPVPGAIQRPKAAAVSQSSAVAAPQGAGSAPGGAGSTPGGAVQIPPYKDTSQIPKKTTTSPTPPSTDDSSWSYQAQANEEKTNQPDLTIAAQTQSNIIPTDQSVTSQPVEGNTTPAASPLPADTPPPPVATPAAVPTTPAALPANPVILPLLPLLLFDFYLADLTPAQQAKLCQRLARLPTPLAQKVLDEYNSAVGRQMPFRNKWGWFEFLIRAALEGRFIPTSDLAERRAAQAQADTPPAPAPTASPPSRQPSTVWRAHREALKRLFSPNDVSINLSPLRATEDGQTLWLEAPNRFVAEWIQAHLAQIEQVLRPHTALPIRVCIG